MGLFSRRDKAPKTEAPVLSASQSKSSLTSGSSSIKSPGFSTSRILNRASAATMSSNPGTPPFSPGLNPGIPRIDIPRPPDPQLDPVGYLRSLGAVRERCKIVTEKALRNELNHFDVDMHKFDDVVTFVANIIKVSRLPSCCCNVGCAGYPAVWCGCQCDPRGSCDSAPT